MNPDESALFGAHPSDYMDIAANHADQIDFDQAYMMVRQYLEVIMHATKAEEQFSRRENAALYAAYTAHLFVKLFQKVYSHAEHDLRIREQLQRTLENS